MSRALGLLAVLLMSTCQHPATLRQAGRSYRHTQSPAALQHVVDHLPPGARRAEIRRLLGAPIDMGFDWRYLLDSTGEQGCVVGAVFHLDDQGRVDQQWLGEICE